MANIILINDKDQEQPLTGVTKLITRGPDGEVEFSVGGGGADTGISLITNIQDFSTDPAQSGWFGKSFDLTGSPMTVKLYVDVPREINIVSWMPRGGIYIYSGSGTSQKGRVVPISTAAWEESNIDETTKRYGAEITFSYTDSEETTGATQGYAYLIYSFYYDGVSISIKNGETILSGPNSAKFLSSSLFLSPGLASSIGETQQFSVYDMREDMGENIKINAMFNMPNTSEVYLPAGIVEIPNYCFYLMPNLGLIDFSLAQVVPTLGSGIVFSQIKSDYKIQVPTVLYNEWITAANWSRFASHIVAV